VNKDNKTLTIGLLQIFLLC